MKDREFLKAIGAVPNNRLTWDDVGATVTLILGIAWVYMVAKIIVFMSHTG